MSSCAGVFVKLFSSLDDGKCVRDNLGPGFCFAVLFDCNVHPRHLFVLVR